MDLTNGDMATILSRCLVAVSDGAHWWTASLPESIWSEAKTHGIDVAGSLRASSLRNAIPTGDAGQRVSFVDPDSSWAQVSRGMMGRTDDDSRCVYSGKAHPILKNEGLIVRASPSLEWIGCRETNAPWSPFEPDVAMALMCSGRVIGIFDPLYVAIFGEVARAHLLSWTVGTINLPINLPVAERVRIGVAAAPAVCLVNLRGEPQALMVGRRCYRAHYQDRILWDSSDGIRPL